MSGRSRRKAQFKGSYAEDEGVKRRRKKPTYESPDWAPPEGSLVDVALAAIDTELVAAARRMPKGCVASAVRFADLARSAVGAIKEPTPVVVDDETDRLHELARDQDESEAAQQESLDALLRLEAAWKQATPEAPVPVVAHDDVQDKARQELLRHCDLKLIAAAGLAEDARRLDAVLVDATATQRRLYAAYDRTRAPVVDHDDPKHLVRTMQQWPARPSPAKRHSTPAAKPSSRKKSKK